MSDLRWIVPVSFLLVIAVGCARPGWVRAVDRWTGPKTVLASSRRRAHRAPGRALCTPRRPR